MMPPDIKSRPRKLPIGYSSLIEVINDGCVYVDKTMFVGNLVDAGKYYFLSRPRRFGKSLFLDTLKQAFLGNQNLFNGLYLENNWEWKKQYPVVQISFSGNQSYIEQFEFTKKIEEVLQGNAEYYNIQLCGDLYSSKFINLVKDLYDKYNKNQVVVFSDRLFDDI